MPGTRRRWWIAAFLSLALPGLGQVYNGQPKKGLLLFIFLVIWSFVALIIAIGIPLARFNLIPLILILVFLLYILIEAIITARRLGSNYQRKTYNKWYIYLIVYAIASFVSELALTPLTKSCIIQAFRIPSGGMEDTLLVGDFIFANKFIYGSKIPFWDIRLPGLREPKPGDIIIFKYPEDPSRDFLKRCVAVGGQTVEIRNKKLYVDGKRFPDPPKVKYDSSRMSRGRILSKKRERVGDNYGPRKLKEGELFMLGDNRDNSQDSRFWGPLPMENVLGKAVIIYFSWDSAAKRIRWNRIDQRIQ